MAAEHCLRHTLAFVPIRSRPFAVQRLSLGASARLSSLHRHRCCNTGALQSRSCASHTEERVSNPLVAAVLGLALVALPVSCPPACVAVGSTDIPEASSAVVAGTQAVLDQQNAGIQRDQDKAKDQGQAKDQVFLDLKIDSEEKGRVRVALYTNVPSGTRRFVELAEGRQGVGYRLSKIDTIAPSFVSSSGVRALSYSADREDESSSIQQLEAEMATLNRPHSKAGMVSLIVRDSKPRPVKERLTAYNGKLITVKEQIGDTSNGTAFNITTQAAPELDGTSLVIGEVVEGMPIIKALSSLPTVRSQSGSPFFKVAKFVGDKRADVAEKAFGRPFSKVVISSAGIVK